jgi:hypothetical protein
MTIAKYIIALTIAATPFSTSGVSDSSSINDDKAYILGFEEGADAATSGFNAQMCAEYYKRAGKSPGPECHVFYENFKLRMARYDKIKNDLKKKTKTQKGKNNGKNSGRNNKDSNY